MSQFDSWVDPGRVGHIVRRRRLDHRRDALAARLVPPERGELAVGQTGAGRLVVGRPRVVDGVVEERRDDDRADVVDRFRGGELLDMANHPRDVPDTVVVAVGLTVAAEQRVEQRPCIARVAGAA